MEQSTAELHSLLNSYRYNVECRNSYERNIRELEKKIKQIMKDNNLETFSSPFSNMGATCFNGKLEIFEYNKI